MNSQMRLYIGVLLAVAVCAAASADTVSEITGTWSIGRYLGGREKAAVACLDEDHIISVGGVAEDGNVNDVWVLNAANGTWEQKMTFGQLPSLNGAGIASSGGYQYLFGGQYSGYYGEASGAVYRVRVSDRSPQWKELIPRSLETAPARYRHSVVAVTADTFVTLFGISRVSIFNDVWQFNTTSLEWTQLASGPATGDGDRYPSSRYNPCCHLYQPAATDEPIIVCFGGTFGDGVGDTNEVWKFSIWSRTWNRVFRGDPTTDPAGNVPTGRRLTQCDVYGMRYLNIFSGFQTGLGPAENKFMYTFDLLTYTWGTKSSLPIAPLPRSGGAMISCSMTMSPLLTQGTNETYNFNDLWRFNIGSRTFTQLEGNMRIPPARSEHVTAVIGTRMYTFFGVDNKNEFLNDVWYFDLVKESWVSHAATCQFGGRRNAYAVPFGSYVYIFGGELENGALTNELIVYDSRARKFVMMNPTGAPPPRKRHAAVNFGMQLLIFGGETLAASRNNDAAVFDIHDQRWHKLDVLGTVRPPPRRSFGMTSDIGTDSIIIANGDGGSNYLMDRWQVIANFDYVGRQYNISYVELPSQLPPGGWVGQYVRAQAAVVGVKSSIYVAGGGVGTLFPPSRDYSTYTWQKSSPVNVHRTSMPIAVYDTSAVYFGRNIYVYGGNLAQDVKIPRPVGAVQILRIPLTYACNDTTNDDTPNCTSCSLGTMDPTCTPVPRGYYMESHTGSPTPCPAGTYSVIPAAFHSYMCEMCPAGTYNGQVGQTSCIPCPPNRTCLIGAIKPLWDIIGMKETVVSSQPRQYQQETDIPIVQVAAPIAAGGVLLCIICVLLDKRHASKWKGHFLSPRAIRKCNRVFRRYTVDAVYLAPKDCYKALRDEFNTTDLFCEDAVDRALTKYREKFGVIHLSQKKFQDIVMLMIGGGYIKPFSDTGYARGEEFDPPFTIIHLRDFDSFETDHSERMGSSLTRRQTGPGGMLTLVFYAIFAIYVSLQFVQYRFASVVETRSVLPTMVVRDTSYSDIHVSVAIATDVGTCLNPDGSCYKGSSLSVTPGGILNKGGISWGCRETDRVCTIDWKCEDCAVVLPNTTLDFVFGSDRAYSSLTRVEIRTNSGIEGQESKSTEMWSVDDPNTLYRGHPGTILSASLLPTQFDDKVVFTPGVAHKSTSYGYQVHFNMDERVDGNLVGVRDFALETGVPISVVLQVEDSTMFVERRLEQSPLDLVAALLGGMSGIGGILVSVMKMHENFSHKFEKKKIDTRLEKKQRAATITEASMEEGLNGDDKGKGFLSSAKSIFNETDDETSDDSDDEEMSEHVQRKRKDRAVSVSDGAPVYRETEGMKKTLDLME